MGRLMNSSLNVAGNRVVGHIAFSPVTISDGIGVGGSPHGD